MRYDRPGGTGYASVLVVWGTMFRSRRVSREGTKGGKVFLSFKRPDRLTHLTLTKK